MTFLLPIESLPENEYERYQRLQEYFCDQRGNSYKQDNKWIVETYWPPTNDYFVDPNIKEGFSWWDSALIPSEAHQQIRNMSGFQLSLNDSWTLYSWSKWLSEKKTAGTIPEEVIILHVDYHNDFMTPRLGYSNGNKIDLLTNETFDITNPESVRKAILSGAVGVGSFIAPFLHEINKVHIRHLWEGQSNKKRMPGGWLGRGLENDTLLAPTQLRPAITFREADISNGLDASYQVTDNLTKWLDNLPNAPILLHIDMDYLNCRYDGDSDWQMHLPRHDPSFNKIQEKIKLIFLSLKEAGLKSRVEDIAVALSPAFYPAEFWKDSIRTVSESIHHLRT